MPFKSKKYFILSLLLIFIGVLVFKYSFKTTDKIDKIESSFAQVNNSKANKAKQTNKQNRYPKAIAIPEYVYPVLDYIKNNGKAPEGYVGGREFKNRERKLDSKTLTGKIIKYREWDVYPKVEGRNRGRERLVTGDDDRAWYTADHYKTFTEIK